MFRVFAILLSLFLLSIPAPASAATAFYVKATGSDSNSGKSLSAPFKTLQKAFNVVNPGDTVFIVGVLKQLKPANMFRGGTADALVRVTGYGTSPTVDGGNGEQKIIRTFAPFIRFDNFTLRNGGVGLEISDSDSIAENLKITDMHRNGATSVGIHIKDIYDSADPSVGNCDRNTVRNNEIWDIVGEGVYIGTAADKGLEVNCSDNQVLNNYIHNFGSDGVEVKQFSLNNVVNDNRIEHGDTGLRINHSTLFSGNTFLDLNDDIKYNDD